MESVFINADTIKTVLAIVKSTSTEKVTSRLKNISNLVSVFFIFNANKDSFTFAKQRRTIDQQNCIVTFCDIRERFIFNFTEDEVVVYIGANISLMDTFSRSDLTLEEAQKYIERLISLTQ
jgi:hypothetical protein